MDKQKKEKIAIAVGLVLITLVAVATIMQATKKQNSPKQTISEQQGAATESLHTISASALQKLIFERKPLSIVDIRSAESFAIEHILDSISLPSDQSFSFPIVPKENHIVIIDDGSQEGLVQTASKSFSDKGYADVSVLSGGIDAWKANNNQTITYGDPTSVLDQAKVSYISTDELKPAVDATNQVLLDVRDKEAFAQGHLKNSINIPFDELESRRREISSTKKLIVCGQNETQEFQAAVKIYDMKLVSPFVLKGSVEKWRQQGFELVK